MALVKYGGGIVQMSGSIAGTTHARNRFGNYARARTKPVNPNTARQQVVRNALAVLVERWSETLNAGQRTAWDLYASNLIMKNRLGEDIHLTGFNHYIRSNSFLMQYALTPVDDGPVIFTLPDKDPALVIAASEATQRIELTFDDGLAWASEDDAYMTVLHGQPQNAQRNFFAGPFRGTRFLSGDVGAPLASPQDTVALFAISEGQHIWVACRILRADGRISEVFRDDVIVAA